MTLEEATEGHRLGLPYLTELEHPNHIAQLSSTSNVGIPSSNILILTLVIGFARSANTGRHFIPMKVALEWAPDVVKSQLKTPSRISRRSKSTICSTGSDVLHSTTRHMCNYNFQVRMEFYPLESTNTFFSGFGKHKPEIALGTETQNVVRCAQRSFGQEIRYFSEGRPPALLKFEMWAWLLRIFCRRIRGTQRAINDHRLAPTLQFHPKCREFPWLRPVPTKYDSTFLNSPLIALLSLCLANEINTIIQDLVAFFLGPMTGLGHRTGKALFAMIWHTTRRHHSVSLIPSNLIQNLLIKDHPCLLGNYVSYATDVTSAADTAARLRSAQEKNPRLVIKNIGHDYLGKSTGKGALKSWTHNLKHIKLFNYSSSAYSGPAIRMGVGVQAFEAYEAAGTVGLQVLGGECVTFELAGGMLSSVHGMGVYQTLEWEVVTASWALITTSPTENAGLYWVLSDDGGVPYGVTLSLTAKAHPDGAASGASMAFSSTSIPIDTFWNALTSARRSFRRLWMPKHICNGLFSDSPPSPFTEYLDTGSMSYQLNVTSLPSFLPHAGRYTGPLLYGPVPIAQHNGETINLLCNICTTTQFYFTAYAFNVSRPPSSSFPKCSAPSLAPVSDMTAQGMLLIGEGNGFQNPKWGEKLYGENYEKLGEIKKNDAWAAWQTVEDSTEFEKELKASNGTATDRPYLNCVTVEAQLNALLPSGFPKTIEGRAIKATIFTRLPPKRIWRMETSSVLYSIHHLGTYSVNFLLSYYIPRRFRENPKWMRKSPALVVLMWSWLCYVGQTKIKMATFLEPRSESDLFFVVEHLPKSIYADILVDDIIRPNDWRNLVPEILQLPLSIAALPYLTLNSIRAFKDNVFEDQQHSYVPLMQAPFKLDIQLWIQEGISEALYGFIVAFANGMQDADYRKV
ncbi:uncharacterized protein BDR25DRAFT_350053 [Lindgomyces ingoldianus]|uniref:Uncharacterized protein n=1 Tax=Lindgomyces ingoldianus TaxID=673940 RepID=A0ACB6R9D7_9PLEO|nr:uncharacterized protein BDR25DRAFT_350053 [Lindgomyces ingoldianus]KAF2475766.1 hypothetical protein BDR25DRAFT_350053 [Lindgomyces ingoldianus]